MPATANAPRTKILRLAKLVAGDLRRGQMTSGLQTVGLAVFENPEAVVAALELLIGEVGKKRPNQALCEALLLMVGQALEVTRMAIEGDGGDPAIRLVEDLRQKLVAAAEAGRLPLEVMMMVAQQFTAAKLDLGDELRALTGALSEQAAAQSPSLGHEDIASLYASMAEALDHDPFLIHGQLSEQLAAFPDDQRLVIIDSFVNSEVASMREAALGWLLDPSPSVVKQVAQSLVAAAKNGSLSAEGAERIVLMRPWLEEGVQSTLDTAVRACRQRGLQSDIRPAVQIAAVFASGCDGAGAQSAFVILKRGRKLALAALLVKHGYGVRDAWLRDDLSRREVDELLAEIGGQIDSFDASPEVVQAVIAHHLADNLGRHEPPPFGLVQFLEALSAAQVRPHRVSTESLIEQILDGKPPERQSGKAIAVALAASKRWPKEYAFLQSWFEQGEVVAASRHTAGTKKQREEAVLRDILPQRRGRWAELLAWTAKAAQDEVEGEECIEFALVARELSGDRPLTEIPLATWIAKNTVAASVGF